LNAAALAFMTTPRPVSLWAVIARACWFALCASAPAGAASVEPPSLDYAVIVTGEELLRGVYADSHTQFLTRALLPLGGHCVYALVVDDRPQDLRQALEFALRHAPLAIVTGGLGPTANDVTRATLSEFTGIPLREEPALVAAMERRFNVSAGTLRANLRRQCAVPERGTWLGNPLGTAAGLVFEHGDYALIALPGPPRELQPMVKDHVVPYLERKFGVRQQQCSVTLRFVGIGQSQIDQTLRDRNIVPSGVSLSTQFDGGRVDFTFSLPDNTPSNQVVLAGLARDVRTVLGEHIYAEGNTTLEERVLGLLRARNVSLVLVEIASAGRLAASLGQAVGAAEVVQGGYVGWNEDQVRRLLRVPDDRWAAAGADAGRLRLLGERARECTGAQWVIVVGPASSSPGSSAAALVGWGHAAEWNTQRLPTQGTGEQVQANLVTQVLARVRRQLEP